MNSSPPPPPEASGPALLIVDDEALFARAAARHLGRAGYACQVAGSLQEARAQLQRQPPALVLLDMRLPDGHGFELLAAHPPGESPERPTFIMLTAYGELEDAVEAMKLGAADYVKKPVDLDELRLVVEKTLSTAQLRRRVDYSRERSVHALDEVQMLGDSPALRAAREQLEALGRLAPRSGIAPPTVLLLGETGTGKDVAARVLHRSGPLRERPFVQIDCASLPRELIEAELFGHEKGAYTGAQGRRVGLIEAAEDGTVFLDELGELGLELQAKLLNVLERRVVRRVGSVREQPVSARFVAGTNRDLAAMVAAGQFRADLYYRLNVIHVTLPPLRERAGDSLLLARHFALQTARRYGLPDPVLVPEAEAALQRYPWPGNVRELRHLIERAVLLGGGAPLGAACLGLPPADPAADLPAPAATGPASERSLDAMTLDEAERHLIERALARCRGNVSEAARQLGVTRMALRYRIDKLRLGGAIPAPP